MIGRRIAGAAAVAGALAGCTPAPLRLGVVDPEQVASAPAPEPVGAGRCAIERRGSVPLDMAGLPTVSASINGRPARLVLDTGAESSIVNVAAARRLGVTSSYDFSRSMAGIGQAVTTGDARLDSMSLGGATLSYPRVLVGPIALRVGPVEPDGLLGASQLGEFDLDIDLPRHRLDLYARTDCPELRPPWSGSWATVETTRSLSLHPFFPLAINGRTLTASLDTGAQRTVLAASAAQRAGIGPGSRIAGSEISAHGAAGETLPAALYAATGIRVGGVPVRGPILVTALQLPHDIDALLGADFLLGHRVWLSYGSRRLFIQ